MSLEELKASARQARDAATAAAHAEQEAVRRAVYDRCMSAITANVDPQLLQAGTLLEVCRTTVGYPEKAVAQAWLCIADHMPIRLRVHLDERHQGPPYQAEFWSPYRPGPNARFHVNVHDISAHRWGGSEHHPVDVGKLLLAAEEKLKELRQFHDRLDRYPPSDSSPVNGWLAMQVFDTPLGRTPRRVVVELEIPAASDDLAKLHVLQSLDRVRTIFSVKRCEIAKTE